jgi:DNA-binding GntR family transcriptional regulator
MGLKSLIKIDMGIRIEEKNLFSLGNALYLALRKAILSGKIPQDTAITEADIVKATNVSRTPVRDAVRKLEMEHLLLRRPDRTLVVARPNCQELKEIFLVRSVLEGLAGKIAAEKINRSHLDKLKNIENKMEQAPTDAKREFYVKGNLEFHKFIVSISNIPILDETLKRFWDVVRMMGLSTLKSGRWRHNSLTEHRAIIEALEKRDGAAVEALIRDHVMHAGDIFTQSYVQSDSTTADAGRDAVNA